MDQLQKLFEKVIGLPPRQEGHGRELQTLEGVLKVGGRGRVEIGLKDKMALKGKPNLIRKIVRYLGVFAPNAKSIVQSLVPPKIRPPVG